MENRITTSFFQKCGYMGPQPVHSITGIAAVQTAAVVHIHVNGQRTKAFTQPTNKIETIKKIHS